MERESSGALAWVRVLGRGAVQLDFGHGVAVNAAGRVLVAARFDARDDDAGDAGEMVTVDASGAAQWRAQLKGATHLRAPHVALDDGGAAYVVGPFAPSNGCGLTGSPHVCVTMLDAEGRPVWCSPLTLMRVVMGLPLQPVVRIAADPHGGAYVALVDVGALRVVRFNRAGGVSWDRRFVFLGSMDPRVGLAVDASGAMHVWGSFSGSLGFDDDEQPLQSLGWSRFLARIQLDGRVRWSQVLRAIRTDDYAVAASASGATLAAVVRREGQACDAGASDLLVARLDSQGAALERMRFAGAEHACASVSVATTGRDDVALAGYFSGAFKIAGQEVRSATPAGEAVFVARLGSAGDAWARVVQGPQLQAGLSVYGDASGAVTIAGWTAGAMDFGGTRIAASDRAMFFVARFHP